MQCEKLPRKYASRVYKGGFQECLESTTKAYQSIAQACLKLTAEWHEVKKELNIKESENDEKQGTRERRDIGTPSQNDSDAVPFTEFGQLFRTSLQQFTTLDQDSDLMIVKSLRQAQDDFQSLDSHISCLKSDLEIAEREIKIKEKKKNPKIDQIQKSLEEHEKNFNAEGHRFLNYLKTYMFRLEDEKFEESYVYKSLEKLDEEKTRSEHFKSGTGRMLRNRDKKTLELSPEDAEKKIASLKTENSEVKCSYEKLKEQIAGLKQMVHDKNELIIELKKRNEKQVYEDSENEYTTSIASKDEKKAYHLLEQGQLPDAALLDKACQTFGLKSPLLKDICTKIEERITNSSDCIIYTNACYKDSEKDKIVFVVITRRATDCVDLSKVQYNVLFRSIDNCSHEGRMVVDKERGLRFEDSELEALENILKDKSPGLMENHSNLTLTSGSMFKSKYKGTKEISIERNNCIVFYVTIKGLIPVGEDLLPKRLGQFDTDVREGRFSFTVGGRPGAKHKNLKLGCRISCKDGAGTIGGFVQHPNFGVCALTCAHVVLSKEEILGIRKKNNENPGIEKECFQPNFNENGENKCGTIVAVQMKEGTSKNYGVDAALVKIDDDRIPTNGHFPDCDLSDIKGGCSHCKDNLVRKSPSFKKGTVLHVDEITTSNNVVKYGQKTKFTIGMLKVKGGSVRMEHCFDMNEEKRTKSNHKTRRYQFTLHKLLEIQDMGSPFAERGDSGALVFSQDDNNKLAAFGLLVGYDSATSITLVQPICSVLKHLGMKKPYSLMNFDPRERQIDQLEKKVNDIGTSLQKISEKLNM